MGNTYRSVLAGGGSGEGASLIITCDSAFAGIDITFTDGSTTFTKTCPSESPYVIEIVGMPVGTWNISAVKDGIIYSTNATISNVNAYVAYFPITSNVSYNTAYGNANNLVSSGGVRYLGTILSQSLSSFYRYYSTSTDIANLVFTNMIKNTNSPLYLFDNKIQAVRSNSIDGINFLVPCYVVYTSLNEDQNAMSTFRNRGNIFNNMRFTTNDHFNFPGATSSSFMSIYEII